eukprot:TRINITY_DN5302_c0_g1_i1.p1 TRINITY_DN5302_c0_g1~~TRINITY_DN5302_c0_g1_i1.p1  ORF type:complete len:131 (-),score=26.07 TRINITY_DN5302_c0_g1_i1:33-368(-)
MSDLETKFRKCVSFIEGLPKDAPYQASTAEKLQFYSLFKQSTEGPVKGKSPSRLNIVAKTKWDSWNSLGKISKEEAMKRYVDKVVEVSRKIPGKSSEELRTLVSSEPKAKL